MTDAVESKSKSGEKVGLKERVSQKIGKEKEYLTFRPVPSPVEDNVRLGVALILGDEKRVGQLESERQEHRESLLTQLPKIAEAIGYIRKTLELPTKDDLAGMMQDLRIRCGLDGYALRMCQTYAFDYYYRKNELQTGWNRLKKQSRITKGGNQAEKMGRAVFEMYKNESKDIPPEKNGPKSKVTAELYPSCVVLKLGGESNLVYKDMQALKAPRLAGGFYTELRRDAPIRYLVVTTTAESSLQQKGLEDHERGHAEDSSTNRYSGEFTRAVYLLHKNKGRIGQMDDRGVELMLSGAMFSEELFTEARQYSRDGQCLIVILSITA